MKITNTTSLEQKKQDADSLITEVVKKVPENRKIEILRIVEGFALCANNEGGKPNDQKVG